MDGPNHSKRLLFAATVWFACWPSVGWAEPGWAEVATAFGLPLGAAAVISLVVSFFAPKLWDHFSAELAARRKYVESTTAQVVELSKTHYWALANAAGTAGELLSNHLRMVEAHLFLRYAQPGVAAEAAADNLTQAVAGIAEQSANASFPSMVRVLVAFERFQLRGSQTYLLPNHAAGRGLRQLYNQFVAALPEQNFAAPIRKAVEQHLAAEPKMAIGDPGPGLAGSFLEDDDAIKRLGLGLAKKVYQDWLRHNLAGVSDAADALRAYGELMSHELGKLNRVFYRDRGNTLRSDEFAETLAARRTWPPTLTDESVFTLRRAASQSEFYSPLGGMERTTPEKRDEEAPSKVSDGSNPDPKPTVK